MAGPLTSGFGGAPPGIRTPNRQNAAVATRAPRPPCGDPARRPPLHQNPSVGRPWQPAGPATTVGTVTKTRLEAFSDGVLAIAITLLVIEIHPPEVHEGERLAHALWAQWPSYAGYLVSFLTIGVIWLNHHRIFEQVARVDGPLLLLNLNLLLWTALIPFPTAVVAENLAAGGDAARTASALYCGVLLLMSLSFGGLFDSAGEFVN